MSSAKVATRALLALLRLATGAEQQQYRQRGEGHPGNTRRAGAATGMGDSKIAARRIDDAIPRGRSLWVGLANEIAGTRVDGPLCDLLFRVSGSGIHHGAGKVGVVQSQAVSKFMSHRALDVGRDAIIEVSPSTPWPVGGREMNRSAGAVQLHIGLPDSPGGDAESGGGERNGEPVAVLPAIVLVVAGGWIGGRAGIAGGHHSRTEHCSKQDQVVVVAGVLIVPDLSLGAPRAFRESEFATPILNGLPARPGASHRSELVSMQRRVAALTLAVNHIAIVPPEAVAVRAGDMRARVGIDTHLSDCQREEDGKNSAHLAFPD